MVHRLRYAAMAGAVGAAEERVIGLYAMAYDSAAAVLAYRSKLLDRALKAVENMALSSRDDFEAQVVVVSAYLASSHKRALPLPLYIAPLHGLLAPGVQSLAGTSRDESSAFQ